MRYLAMTCALLGGLACSDDPVGPALDAVGTYVLLARNGTVLPSAIRLPAPTTGIEEDAWILGGELVLSDDARHAMKLNVLYENGDYPYTVHVEGGAYSVSGRSIRLRFEPGDPAYGGSFDDSGLNLTIGAGTDYGTLLFSRDPIHQGL